MNQKSQLSRKSNSSNSGLTYVQIIYDLIMFHLLSTLSAEMFNRKAQYWVTKGEERVSYRQYSEALNCFERAIEIQPNKANAWYGKAIVELDTGKLPAALNSVNTALRFDTQNQIFQGLKILIEQQEHDRN